MSAGSVLAVTPQADALQRSDTEMKMQVLPGGSGARTYQDERFSYVVLRRGPHPGVNTIPDVTIARQRQVDPPDDVQKAIEAGTHLLTLSSYGPKPVYRNPEALSTVESQNMGAHNVPDVTIARQRSLQVLCRKPLKQE